MKKINWRVATKFLVVSSAIGAVITIPTVATLTNKNHETNKLIANSYIQDTGVISDQTFKPSPDNPHSGVQGQTLHLTFSVTNKMKSFVLTDESTNKTITTGTINNGKIEVNVKLPFNKTNLELNFSLYETPQVGVTTNNHWVFGSNIIQLNLFDITILQPTIEKQALITSQSNSENQSLIVSSTIPVTINQPLGEKPQYFWQNTKDESLIPVKLSKNGKSILFPQDKIEANYGQTFNLVEKFDNYNKTIVASKSPITLNKPVAPVVKPKNNTTNSKTETKKPNQSAESPDKHVVNSNNNDQQHNELKNKKPVDTKHENPSKVHEKPSNNSAKHVDEKQHQKDNVSKQPEHIEKPSKIDETKQNHHIEKSTIQIQTIDHIEGVQGQKVDLLVGVKNVNKPTEFTFEIKSLDGSTHNAKVELQKGDSEVQIPINLPFNKTYEKYTLTTSFNGEEYKHEITAKILEPKASELKTPKLLLGNDRIKGVSVVASQINNAPNDGSPIYYWQTKDGKIKLSAIKEGNSYTLPEREIGTALNKEWELIAKYKNLDTPVVVSNSVLVSHKFNIHTDWWIIPTIFAITGAAALSIGLFWYVKAKIKRRF